MEVLEIKEKLKSLNSRLESYERAIENIDKVKDQISDLTIELDVAIEQEKENPWLYNPDVVLIYGKDAPTLKVHPHVKDSYCNYSNNPEYSIHGKDLIGISKKTNQPYKYKSSSNTTGKWCKSFRVRKKALQEYKQDCIEYLQNAANLLDLQEDTNGNNI